MAANGYGSEPTAGSGPWPAANPSQSAWFEFDLPGFTVTTNWAADHSTLNLGVVQSPANASIFYTLGGSPPSAASMLLVQGNLTNWTTSQLLLTGEGALSLEELGWDVEDVTASYDGVTYKLADWGLDFRGYTLQTWTGSWAATAPVTFNPPPARYTTPTSIALNCATAGATIFLQVTPDPGNDTNLVGVSGSPWPSTGPIPGAASATSMIRRGPLYPLQWNQLEPRLGWSGHALHQRQPLRRLLDGFATGVNPPRSLPPPWAGIATPPVDHRDQHSD